MQLEQRQTLSQKLVLTQTMRQSLDCLQLSAPELSEYVQEVALSNPLLDVQSPTYYETELPSEAAPAEREPLEVRETDSWRGVTSSGMEDVQDFTAFLTREKTFRDHLTEQIGQMKLVDDELDGSVPISFCGGADAWNFADLVSDGMAPVTVCTDLLKPGGYARLSQYLENLGAAMDAAGFPADLAEVTMRADNDIAVEGETAQQVAKLLRWLEDLDDVQNVYSNAELGEDAYA